MTTHWHDDEYGYCPCDEPTEPTTQKAAEPKYVLWPGNAGTSAAIETEALHALAGYVRQRDGQTTED